MQNRKKTLYRVSSYLMTLLMAVGQAPAFAATAPDKPTSGAVEREVALLQYQFQAELAHTNLTLAGAPKVTADDMGSQVTLLAVAPADLSRSGRLVHTKNSYVAAIDGGAAVAASEDVKVDVSLETQQVNVTTLLGFEGAFNGLNGRPALQGLQIENVVSIPLDEYRAAASAADPQQAFDELSKKLEAQEAKVSRTTVILPNGNRTTFRGGEMTIDQALEGAVRNGALTQVSLSCVRTCFNRINRSISIAKAICMAAVVVGCGASCFFIGPACLGCFVVGIRGCSIAAAGAQLATLVHCLLQCR